MKKIAVIVSAVFFLPFFASASPLTFDTGNQTYTGSATTFTTAFNPSDSAVLIVLSIGFNNGDVTGLSCSFDGEAFHEVSTQVQSIVANHTLILSTGGGDSIATTGNIVCNWTTARYASIVFTSYTGDTAIYLSKVQGAGTWSTNPTTITSTSVTLGDDESLIGSISDDKASGTLPDCNRNDRYTANSGGGDTNICDISGAGAKDFAWTWNVVGNPNNYIWNELVFSGVASSSPPATASTSDEYYQACIDLNGTSTCSLLQEAGNIRLILLILLVLALFYTIEHYYYHIFNGKL